MRPEEMSPLQQRLLATYMNALEEQEDDAQDAVKAPVQKTEAPKPEQSPESARARSDLYAKKMSELLLKGWKMLGENCPETGEVPLMQHPSNGRKFSIATGQYTDEMEQYKAAKSPARAAPAPSPPKPAAPSPAEPPRPSPKPTVAFPTIASSPAAVPASTPMTFSALRKAASNDTGASPGRINGNGTAHKAGEKRDDDQWCADMSSLMLKGWKMLNETCPVTGLVPLMEHPTNGRKFSTAAKKYIDEIDGEAKPEEKEEEERTDEAEEWFRSTGRAVEAIPIVSSPTTRNRAPPPPPPTRIVSSAAASADSSSPAMLTSIAAVGGWTDDVAAHSLSALDDAAAAVSQQLAAASAQLASAPAPQQRVLLESIAKCAEALEGIQKARRACAPAADA